VESVYFMGDEGEYELMAYHYPLIGALPEGEVRIAGHANVPLRAGVVLFQQNSCVVIVEESEEARPGQAEAKPPAEVKK
jgi:F0F1-type ATP synthase epsilon subunit